MCLPVRAVVRAALAVSISILAAVLVSGTGPVRAHEGHDHAEPAARAEGLASPRVTATSEAYQFVGIVEGEVLVVYLDRAESNEPVTAAALEVSLNGQAFTAEAQKNGTYEVTAPLLKEPGQIEVLVTVAEAGKTDLLAGGLAIPSPHEAHDDAAPGWWSRVIALFTGETEAVAAARDEPGATGSGGRLALAGLAAGFLAACAAGLLAWRRRAALVLVPALCLLALAGSAAAHEGHDHGADLKASSGNSPQRRPDGTIFLPKPSQRLLEIRTSVLAAQTARRAVRLTGRVAANPNFSGVVQSTIAGRYEAPDGGVPPLGTRVKKGDLLGRVAPSFASIDSSDMAQTLGDIEQKLAIARAKLARQERLQRTNVVAHALVDETRMEVEGLAKRQSDLLAAKVRAEDLHAPVDGVIASSSAVSGKVVGQSDKLFEIIDPARLLIEALVFDQIDPDAVNEARAIVPGGGTAALRVLGRSHALQQQYTLMQFEVLDGNSALSVGLPVTVSARTGPAISGLLVPRAALAQAANGQNVVFEQREPEVFVPRAVRTEPFDSETVLVTGGVEAGAKIVVRNAPLVNQVR